MASTILIFLSVETSLDKEKNRNYTHTSNFTSKLTNQQTITQNLKQKIWITFRFASSLFQRPVRFDGIQWVRYNDHQKACVVFFDSLHLRSQHQWRWIFYIQRYESKWHEEMKNNNQCESVTQSIQFVFFTDLCLFVVNTSYSEYLQPIRTSRLIKTRKVQIRKVWNSIRSRNQYRSAISTWFWDIDRFIILICKYLRDQDSQQNSHSRDFIFFVFALLLLSTNLSLHICRICFETFCFNDDQTDIWVTVNEFLCSVDR